VPTSTSLGCLPAWISRPVRDHAEREPQRVPVLKATLSEATVDIRIEGEVTGQIAIGDHIVQVTADCGAIVNVAPPQEEIVPDGAPNRPITRMSDDV
jgi:hypothetical protein